MQQGKAADNQTECWWCGLPIKYHSKSQYDNYGFIGLYCNEKLAKANYESQKLFQKSDSQKPSRLEQTKARFGLS